MEDKPNCLNKDEDMPPKENTKQHTPPDNHSDSDEGNDHQQQNIPMDEDDQDPVDEIENEDESDYNLAELDDNIDSLNAALDLMEQKTDFIQKQLRELLTSNREIRQSILAEKNNKENVDGTENDENGSSM